MRQTEPSPQPGIENAARDSWRLIRRMLGIAWSYRRGCIRVIVLQSLLLIMGLLGLGQMGLGVDYIRFQMAAASNAGGAPAGHGSFYSESMPCPKPPPWPLGIKPPPDWSRMEVLTAIACSIFLLAILRAAVNYAALVDTNRLVQGRIVVHLRSKIYAKMQRLSFSFFDANETGSLINRTTGDVQSVRMFIDGVLLTTINLALSLVIYLAYMLRINPMLTLVCLASTPMLWILTAKFSRTVKPAYDENRSLFDRLVLALSENIQGVHVVKGFARQQEQVSHFGRINRQYRTQQHWIFRQVSFFQPLIHFITHINLVAMIAYGGLLVVRHEQAPDAETAASVGITVGQLLVFAGLLQQFSGQISAVTTIADSIQQSLIGARRVFEVLDTPVEIKSPVDAVKLTRVEGKLEFQNVAFSYRPGEPVLDKVSFTLAPGQCAAILGQTGAGKTTLMSLIPRFYDPDAGSILLDGRDLRTLDLESLRRNTGIVFQESFLFSNSVSANIAFGHPEATREQIRRAAETAHAHEFITELPDGYETILHEGGANLSGGQKQRIAIARALLLEPKILLMDDPTAAIDPETEKEILVSMESAMRGRTTLIVAHRLSTLKRADTVIVLDRGQIIQRGTHDQLMNTGGHYRFAARLQIPDKITLDLLDDLEVSI